MVDIFGIREALYLIGVHFMQMLPASYIQFGAVQYYQIVTEQLIYGNYLIQITQIGLKEKFMMLEDFRGQ